MADASRFPRLAPPFAAQSSSARAPYHEHRCRSGYASACLVAADLVHDTDPAWSLRLRRRARYDHRD